MEQGGEGCMSQEGGGEPTGRPRRVRELSTLGWGGAGAPGGARPGRTWCAGPDLGLYPSAGTQ